MKVTRRSFARLVGGLFLAPQIAPALESKRLPLAPTIPVQESSDPIATRFLEAIINEEDVPLYYQGGTTPGVFRRFMPTSLYRLSPGGPILASGHCLLRDSTRTLRLDRVRLA
jgi:predicted DNA-binding transcriptional regulator YafY